MSLAPYIPVSDQQAWESERDALLGRKISELGLSIRGSRVERLVEALYAAIPATRTASVEECRTTRSSC
jgi:hypothetical protein